MGNKTHSAIDKCYICNNTYMHYCPEGSYNKRGTNCEERHFHLPLGKWSDKHNQSVTECSDCGIKLDYSGNYCKFWLFGSRKLAINKKTYYRLAAGLVFWISHIFVFILYAILFYM